MKNLFARQWARLQRVRSMSAATILQKIREKTTFRFSYATNIRRLAHRLDRHSLRFFLDAYQERPEGGPTNLETKLLRQAGGGPFEPDSVSLVNRAALELVDSPRTLLEVGCGTGMFAALVAARHPDIAITASELDEPTLQWARQNRAMKNISYQRLLLEECSVDQFDLVVAIEVVEHIFDFAGFLRGLAKVAPRAIVSTPNKNRSPFTAIANTPAYGEHVREWTAGEFYWVLRCFYDQVELHTLPNFQKQVSAYVSDSSFKPTLRKCSVLEKEVPLIAVCSLPRRA
jgi:2-polyprenyl-3-methyl-5-hydroxy-6-metoxy-1,4-benzoquinol methylase